MSARTELVDGLLEEAARGWPEPWCAADRDAKALTTVGLGNRQAEALERYIDLIGDAVAAIPFGEHRRYKHEEAA